MDKKYIIFQIIIFFISFSLFISFFSQNVYSEYLFGATEDFIKDGKFDTFADSNTFHLNPRVDSWYQVNDWEVAVCMQYGGTKESYNQNKITRAESTSDFDIAAIQASKKKIIQPTGEKEKQKYIWQYEFSWYYFPFAENKDYTIYLIKDSQKKEVGKGSASQLQGESGFNIYESEEEYQNFMLESNKDDSFSVPVIEKKN